MKRALKIIGLVFLAILLLVGGVVAYLWEPLSTFPQMPSAYEAKELCSCLFVEGRPQDACELFIKQDVVSIDGRSFDMEKKTVSVKALWNEGRARYVSPTYGCVIE